MKIAQLVEKQHIKIQEMTRQTLLENEVRVKVVACGICGSDIPRYFAGRVHFFPIVLGHEFSGTIIECGDSVEGLSVGDRVAGIPLIPCMSCPSCLRGDYSLCKHYRFIGSSVNGALSEEIVLPSSNVLKLPNSVDLHDAVFMETSAVACHAVMKLGNFVDESVCVIGTGTIGLLTAQWAKILGAKNVVIVGRGIGEDYSYRTRQIGVSYLSSSTEDFKQQVIEFTKDQGFKFVIDAVGKKETIQESIDIVACGGKIIFVGTPDSEVSFSAKEWTLINRKEISMIGSWMGYSNPWPGKEWKMTLEQLEKRKLILDQLLTYAKFPLIDVERGFNLYKAGTTVSGRVLIVNGDLR